MLGFVSTTSRLLGRGAISGSPVLSNGVLNVAGRALASTATTSADNVNAKSGAKKSPAAPGLATPFLAPSEELRKQFGSLGADMARPAYFDYQATTPMDPRVVEKMMPVFTKAFGNAHSRTHMYGWEAEKYVEDAREQVASLIGAEAKNIIFTSGATESNNLALKGLAQFYGGLTGPSERKKHIITTQIEHKCVLASCQALERLGWDVTYLPVDVEGLVDVKELEKAIRPDTLCVSVMMVNNEIGVLQSVKEIGKICRSKGVFFHTDAAQAVGKVPINVDEMNIDLMSISAHKLYGPKGIGALYVRSKPRVRLVPQISGGGQERGLRSGTIPVPLVVGMGEACRIAAADMQTDTAHVTRLAERLKTKLQSRLENVNVNGSWTQRYVGNINLSFAFVEGESLLMSLDNVAVSSGSACTSASLEPSYVLRSIGVDEELAHTSLRFGIGRFTTEKEIDDCVETVVESVKKLRALSPLAEIAAEGGSLKDLVWT